MGGVRRGGGGGGGGLDMGMGMVMGGLRGLGDPGECIFRVVGGRGGGVIECVEAVYWWGRWMEGGGGVHSHGISLVFSHSDWRENAFTVEGAV